MQAEGTGRSRAQGDTGLRGHLSSQHCNVGNRDPHLPPHTETDSRWTLAQNGGIQATKLLNESEDEPCDPGGAAKVSSTGHEKH